MDTVLLEARGVLESIAPHLLQELEAVQRAQFELACPDVGTCPGASSCLPALSRRPTAASGEPHTQQPNRLPVIWVAVHTLCISKLRLWPRYCLVSRISLALHFFGPQRVAVPKTCVEMGDTQQVMRCPGSS